LPAANRDNAGKTALFARLSLQRLESPQAFSELARLRAMIQTRTVAAIAAVLECRFETPRRAMVVNRYFSGGFRDRIVR
jgi:hypothetical protein